MSLSPPAAAPTARARPLRPLRWLALRLLVAVVTVVAVFSVLNPPTTLTILAEGDGSRRWVPLSAVSPDLARAVVAAEDANFCRHWGFDMAEIRKVIAAGDSRGASTLTQQTAKNVFLWQGRSWPRKALETLLTPAIEAFWTKRRILEVYLNVAEFGPGVFGAEAAAQHWFGVPAARLTARQSARLAAILPAPKTRDPRGAPVSGRAAAIAEGAATIAADGRAACFAP